MKINNLFKAVQKIIIAILDLIAKNHLVMESGKVTGYVGRDYIYTAFDTTDPSLSNDGSKDIASQ